MSYIEGRGTHSFFSLAQFKIKQGKFNLPYNGGEQHKQNHFSDDFYVKDHRCHLQQFLVCRIHKQQTPDGQAWLQGKYNKSIASIFKKF